ncbi:uncharacterized protein LOC129771995 [Toxorhynchites rutilus septentrionalis]|uniref:uncharacterized protein LOC129771995 n=1 Tax=Toxorhynchites rutilus septentrionalis TaxID=329112 RepID=UPI0024788207|nr:uncharacterized protein LOC129771995 [Toxorhynchites rutilus septentrionalis]
MATKWVWASASGPFPPNMVEGGQDSDGCPIYVGRANHAGDVVPAKVIPQKNAAYIAHGGEEILVESIEVLCQKELLWDNATGGNIPPDAVVGGSTVDGELLYVGRAVHEGSQTIGKVQRSHGCLYIPYGGAEVALQGYEVLCER